MARKDKDETICFRTKHKVQLQRPRTHISISMFVCTCITVSLANRIWNDKTKHNAKFNFFFSFLSFVCYDFTANILCALHICFVDAWNPISFVFHFVAWLFPSSLPSQPLLSLSKLEKCILWMRRRRFRWNSNNRILYSVGSAITKMWMPQLMTVHKPKKCYWKIVLSSVWASCYRLLSMTFIEYDLRGMNLKLFKESRTVQKGQLVWTLTFCQIHPPVWQSRMFVFERASEKGRENETEMPQF